MNKEVNFEKDAQTKIVEGINITANAVGGTLGPRGLNCYIDHPMQPKWTNDGATIATNIVFKDPLKNAGAKLVKNCCGQTNDDAGDGTTTTAVLLQALVGESLKRPENPMHIRESLLEASKKVVKEIKKASHKINKEEIEKVALISAENESLATAISEIINKVGEQAVITVEDSYDGTISYEIVEGYEAGVGFMSPVFINQTKKAECILNDVPVFVTDKKISAVSDIKPLWDKFKQEGISSCVIVCEDIEAPILGIFSVNKSAGLFTTLVVRATGDLLKDIEASVGATRVSDSTGVSFQTIDIKHLGFCKKVVSDVNKTLFIPKNSSKADSYASNLEKVAESEPNIYLKERFKRRISQLRGGVAILKIGASDFEREYLKDKADDAIKASKSALEEGIVEGGGMCLWRIAQAMKPKTVGEEILKKALVAPFKRIVENAGKDYAEIVGMVNQKSNMFNGFQEKPVAFGYDAKWDKLIPLIPNGIIDPAKVERCALENSVANCAQFITGFCSITDEIEDARKT